VQTLQALAALPVLQLSERLGQPGVRLSELARGTKAACAGSGAGVDHFCGGDGAG